MTAPANHHELRAHGGLGGVLTAAALLTMACAAAFCAYWPFGLPPAQPIPFSHRVHAGIKQIGCFFCHEGARTGARAGVPPVSRCMLCHERVAVTHPQIRRVRQHYFQNQPIDWVKVTVLPEFVYFDHQMHVQYGLDCGWCHGDVKSMDRIELKYELLMGFCVDCHRRSGATHDCLACHR